MADIDDRYNRITFRIPKDLHVKLMDCSVGSSHSMNAEIIARLENSFIVPDAIQELLDAEEARLRTQSLWMKTLTETDILGTEEQEDFIEELRQNMRSARRRFQDAILGLARFLRRP